MCSCFFFLSFSLHQRNRISSIYCCKRWFYFQWLTFVHVSQRCNLHFMDSNKNEHIERMKLKEVEEESAEHIEAFEMKFIWQCMTPTVWLVVKLHDIEIAFRAQLHIVPWFRFHWFHAVFSHILHLSVSPLIWCICRRNTWLHIQNRTSANKTPKWYTLEKIRGVIVGCGVVMTGNENRNSTICYTVFI